MLSLRGLTKHYGKHLAVDRLSFDVGSGKVTGFLGPHGSGKTTTMRLVLGLATPSAGEALIGGERYTELRHPLRRVGAALGPDTAHRGLTARRHLSAMARSNGLPRRRADEVLGALGLEEIADHRIRSMPLGMVQRLSIAGALLGDPEVLLFDEPLNGLGPDHVQWARRLMHHLAAEGRTVFVSSDPTNEVQTVADRLVVIGKGRLIADAPASELIGAGSMTTARVCTPQPAELAQQLVAAGMRVERHGDELVVTGGALERIGDVAHRAQIRLDELTTHTASLEQAYTELAASSVRAAKPSEGATPTRAVGGDRGDHDENEQV